MGAFRDKAMGCPQCGTPLVAYDDRDKWRCKTCNGVLVGHDQLQIELGDLAGMVLEEAADANRVAARPCPVCVFAMSPYTMGGVELDRCVNDEVVWFDGGEIGKLRLLIAEANPETPFIMRVVETLLEVRAEEAAEASGAYDDLSPADAPVAEDWQARKLCSDGACHGVLGDDGICHVCKRAPAS